MLTTRHRRPDVDHLSGIGLFSGCTEKELAAIDRLTCSSFVTPGTVLCREGCFGHQTFVVVSGQARVTIGDVEIATLGCGSFFGEMSVLDGSRRVATVTAITPMTVLVMSPQELDALLTEVPSVARRMLAAVGGRLRLADRALSRQGHASPTPG